MKTTSEELCWRKYGKTGDHTHIFWDCPIIQGFWKGVKEEIGKILELDIPLDPLVFLLGAIPKEEYSVEHRYILRILLLTAKKMITVNLKEEGPPAIAQWLQKLKHVYIME